MQGHTVRGAGNKTHRSWAVWDGGAGSQGRCPRGVFEPRSEGGEGANWEEGAGRRVGWREAARLRNLRGLRGQVARAERAGIQAGLDVQGFSYRLDQGLSASALVALGARSSSPPVGSSCPCGMFSSLSGLCPLDDSSTQPPKL